MSRSDRSQKQWKKWRPLLVGAFVILIFFGLGYLGITNFHLAGELNRVRAELGAMEAEKQALEDELQSERARQHDAQEEAVEQLPPSAPLWSREGLEEQPRLQEFKAQAGAAGMDPGTTQWRLAEPLPSADVTGWDSPGELLIAMASEMTWDEALGRDTWEMTMRILSTAEREAVGMILIWGLKDDAVAGVDYRITLHRDERGWSVARIERREHCRRGLTSDSEHCL